VTRRAQNNPRFQGENFAKNLAIVKELQKLADKKGLTCASSVWPVTASPES
jgi:aryl-alcohol dehydrogenase-like predicted oxidoreductase